MDKSNLIENLSKKTPIAEDNMYTCDYLIVEGGVSTRCGKSWTSNRSLKQHIHSHYNKRKSIVSENVEATNIAVESDLLNPNKQIQTCLNCRQTFRTTSGFDRHANTCKNKTIKLKIMPPVNAQEESDILKQKKRKIKEYEGPVSNQKHMTVNIPEKKNEK
jgi:hypothetical protein